MKTFSEITNEAKKDTSEFANMNMVSIIQSIGNGNETKKVDGVSISPKQAKSIYSLINVLDISDQKKILKKNMKGILAVFKSIM